MNKPLGDVIASQSKLSSQVLSPSNQLIMSGQGAAILGTHS